MFISILQIPNEKVTLRIRTPQSNTNGSIMLVSTEGAVWECIECCESWTERYTEKHWVEKFQGIYGSLSTEEIRRMKQHNKNESCFKYMRRLSDGKIDGSIKHSAWDPLGATLELQIEEIVVPEKGVMGCIKYTNIFLKFRNLSDDTDVLPLLRASKKQRV